MSRLRQRVAERLVQSQSTAAILTTFNEVNMAPVIELRNRYKERFEKEHGVKLGFMSFFVKAAVHALRKYPIVNASIDGGDITRAVAEHANRVLDDRHDGDEVTTATGNRFWLRAASAPGNAKISTAISTGIG